MSINQPAFRPDAGKSTVKLAAGTSSGNVQVQSGNLNRHVRVINAGTVTAYVNFGADNTLTASVPTGTGASAGHYPIAGGAVEIIGCPYPYVAAITAAGSADLYLTPGEGL